MSSSRTISPPSPPPSFLLPKVYANPPFLSSESVNSTRDHEAGSGSSARLIYSEAIFRVPPLGGEPPEEEVLDKRITIIGRLARASPPIDLTRFSTPSHTVARRSKATTQSARRSYKLDSGNILDALKPPETTVIRFRSAVRNFLPREWKSGKRQYARLAPTTPSLESFPFLVACS